jgi:hypothetical protein
MAGTKGKAVESGGVNFLDLGFYSGGFLLPPGRYAMEHNIVLHQGRDKDGNPKGDPRLGVMLSAHPLAGGDAIEQFLSMGTKAHLSYMPNETGKGLSPVPGGPGNVSNKSNFYIYLESLMNCGAKDAPITPNDIASLDGIWVVTDNIPEPEDRKGFASGTSEVEQPQSGPRKTVIVSEIIDGGKPWEGGGGVPDGAQTPVHTKPAVAKFPPAKKTTSIAAAATQAAGADDEATFEAATNAIAAVLTRPTNAKGMLKIMLKTQAFKAIKDANDDATAQKAMEMFFGNDDTSLRQLLEGITFTIDGQKVVPQ